MTTRSRSRHTLLPASVCAAVLMMTQAHADDPAPPSLPYSRVMLQRCVAREFNATVHLPVDLQTAVLTLLEDCSTEWGAFGWACESAGRTKDDCNVEALVIVTSVLR